MRKDDFFLAELRNIKILMWIDVNYFKYSKSYYTLSKEYIDIKLKNKDKTLRLQ